MLAVASAALLPAGAAGGSVRAERASCADLGALSGYEVFVAGNIDVSNNQLLGAAAAARSLRMSSYGVSAGLAPDPARLDLIAGANLDVSNAHANGSVRYGGTLTGSITVPSGGTVAHGPYPFSFDEEIERMQVLSSAWGALAGTEAKKPAGEVLELKGTAPGLNVFHVTSAILQGVRDTTISVPAGASALIDVSGPSYSTALAGAYGAGDSAVPAIWNFTEATAVQISGLNWFGAVLAPNAAVNAGNGQIYGAIWAHDWEGSGTVLHGSLPGCLPPLPPQALALSALCVDPVTGQLAMRLRNTGEDDLPVSWHDERSAQSGTFESKAGSDTYFHVLEGEQPHTIVASAGGQTVRAEGTSRHCEGTIRVHKSISGAGTPPAGPWEVRVSGTSGFSATRDVTAGGTVEVAVPGTFEAGSAPIGA
jgi:choice-of-anchor A domain-containing protein